MSEREEAEENTEGQRRATLAAGLMITLSVCLLIGTSPTIWSVAVRVKHWLIG